MMDRFTGGDIQKAIDLEPVSRLGKPEEIAEAVLWMSSDLGGFVTSASILSVMLAASANESACEGRG